jgi:hypothetical protein
MCPASCFGASDGVASRILELGMAAGAKECARELIFCPLGLFGIPLFPRLTPWAAIFRRFAAGSGHQLFQRIAKYLVLRHTLKPDKLEVLDAVLKCPPFHDALRQRFSTTLLQLLKYSRACWIRPRQSNGKHPAVCGFRHSRVGVPAPHLLGLSMDASPSTEEQKQIPPFARNDKNLE